MTDFPMAHFGSADNIPQIGAADADDPDDEQIATPADVTAMLGFDPAAADSDNEGKSVLEIVTDVACRLIRFVDGGEPKCS